MSWKAIAGFRLVAADPARLARFYAALGFTAGEARPIPADEMRVLGLAGAGLRLPLILGPSRLDLDQFEVGGRPYPSGTIAADLIFQHLALVTDDAAVAWDRARAAGAVPISRGGPVTLPASSGGVTAIKFRDPEGHPLEFLQFPAGADPWWRGTGVLGIDHSAIAVSDVAASRRFYEGEGLQEGKATINEGAMQVELDGLDDVLVDVVPLHPPTTRPHLELLRYRFSPERRHLAFEASDVAATRIVWQADAETLVRDPDGHLHQLTR